MKKISRRIKSKPILVMLVVFFVLFMLSTICLIYSILKIANIENLIRYLISALLILLAIFNLLQCYRIIFKGKFLGILLLSIIFLALFISESYVCGIITGLYNRVDSLYKESYTYTTSLIVKTDTNLKDIEDIKSFKIGLINYGSSVDGYQIAKEIIDENKLEKSNEIITYDSIGEVIGALYNNEIDAALVTSTYTSMFVNIDEYKDIKTDTKVIYSKSKTIKKGDTSSNKNNDEPFTVLILGVDSVESDISKVTSFNADSLMLITFNPKTYNATILSIPRDTYVPIACIKNKPSSKITHSGWYGESCVVKTIEEWMNIDIDYYVKINFTGVVNLVDAIDGIEVNVPYSFCEQNSNREWGKNTIYVEKGLQTLNGEQALALSRNRHPNAECGNKWSNYTSSDLVRGQNQQLIINALINKITKNIDLNKIYKIMDVIGKNMDTNMTTNEILSYYSLAKEIALKEGNSTDVISFERLYLSTYGKSMYDVLMKISGISYQIYYKDSLSAIIKEMNINLGKDEPILLKTFSFSINNLYKQTIIGKGTFNQIDMEVVPNFKGKDKSVAETWAKSKNIEIFIEYKDVAEGTDGIVIKQSIPATYIFNNYDKSKGLTITVAKLVNIDKADDSTKDFPTE